MENTNGCSLDDKHLSTDFTVWESMQNWRPEDLAISITESVARLFSLLSPEDVLQSGLYMQNIEENRSNLCGDVYACLVADRKHIDYFMKLAEVR
jgi:hypothetical protein